jgi:hypothetical protein
MLATRIERAQNAAIAVVADVVRAEAGKLAAAGVFSFGSAPASIKTETMAA